MSDEYIMAKRDMLELTKEEWKLVNSKKRMVGAIIWGILEYILIIVLVFVVSVYSQKGNLDTILEDLQGLTEWFRPGGMIFNAIIGFLPIIILGSIGAYFGSGTYGKMLFGIARCIAFVIFINLLVNGATTSLEVPSVFQQMNLENLTIGMEGLRKFLTLIFLTSILIPIGEFCGARKPHKRAVEKLEAFKASKVSE
ncbi:MAG: hypothetical protein MJZ38_03065 [archaeon]|nr:hypothetical protein [archaeon]